MFYDHWNTFLLIAPIGLLCLTNGPQPRFHALIMLCTGFLGMRLHKAEMLGAWSIDSLVYIILNIITLALSPLQLILLWYLSPKPEIDDGIVIHHEGDESGNISVDILAVHGLGSNPAWAWTWEDKETGNKCMWLKDLLPKAIPRARIMAYNHNSAWFRDAPVKSVRICGEQLLEALDFRRRLPQEVERPVIFIGHSFGGIVVKQALVAAGEKNTDSAYQSIGDSMHGALFLGVPHDGSRLTTWGKLLSYCTYWLGSSTELLESLQSGAGLLRQLNRSFLTSYGGRDLVDFFELHRTKTFGISLLLGVDTQSSTNPGVKRIPLEADHIGMNKFKSEKHHNFELVIGQIMRMVDKVEKEQLKVLSLEQKECLQSLYLDGSENRRETITKPYKSTFQWVGSNPVIRSWMEKKSQVIWISGKAGSGKSTLTKYLLDCMIQEQKRQKQQGIFNHLQGTSAIISFFFNGQGSEPQRSERGFLQAILYQLVEQTPSLSCLIPQQKTESAGKKVLPSLNSLRKTLLLVLGDPKIKSIRLLIDAFDECEEECKSELLKFILEDLAKHPALPQILITSRRHLELEIFLESYPAIKLEDLNSEDIHTYLGSEFETFTRFHGPEFVKRLVENAEARSQGVFLWVKLVVKELKKGKMLVGTAQELEKTLSSLPGDLAQFYDRILKGLDTSANAEERRMLEWVLFAERPLSVAEFRYAISIGSEPPPSNLISVEKTTVPVSRMEARIREYSGGLLEVKRRVGSKYAGKGDSDLTGNIEQSMDENLYVQLIHQSVKDCLLKTTKASEIPLIIPSKAHSHLARVCITYLAFPDFDINDLPVLEAKKITFFEYATKSWITHAPLAEPCERTTHMMKFGWPKRQNFRIWSENYFRLQDPEVIWEPSEWGDPLLVASRIGLSADVEHFLRSSEQSNDHIKAASKALVAAASGGHEVVAQVALEMGADVNTEGGIALHVAADRGYEKVVRLLLRNGADVNAEGGNALQLAAFKGHEKVTQLLLEKGADVRAQGGDFGGVLQAAASGGHGKVVRLLLENFVSAVQAAVDENHTNVAHQLLESTSDDNTLENPFGDVLQAAAYDGRETIVQLLLKNGADVNSQGGSFGNALRAAARGGHSNIVQLLLENGADVKTLGGSYGNALQAAASKGHEKAMELLLADGADRNTLVIFGDALQTAARNGHEKIVQLLLKNGADVNAEGKGYGNALQTAAHEGHDKIVQLLLENGADVNAQGGSFGDALQGAVFEGHEEIIRLLLAKGADINAKEGPFGNALQVAARRGYMNVVQLLLEEGADASVLGEGFGEAMAEGGYVKVRRLLDESSPQIYVGKKF